MVLKSMALKYRFMECNPPPSVWLEATGTKQDPLKVVASIANPQHTISAAVKCLETGVRADFETAVCVIGPNKDKRRREFINFNRQSFLSSKSSRTMSSNARYKMLVSDVAKCSVLLS